MPTAVEPSRGDVKEVSNDKNIELSVTLEAKFRSNERFCSFELFSGPDTTEETYQQWVIKSIS